MSAVSLYAIVDKSAGEQVDASYLVHGSIKSRATFTTVTTTAITESFNVASLTDNGTGDTTVNYTNNMNSADFSVTTAHNSGIAYGAKLTVTAKAAGSAQVKLIQGVSSTGLDISDNNVIVAGDVA